MTIKRIDHIAIVVENLEEALGVYRDASGMTVTDVREMPEQDVKMAFLPSGDCEIELLEPLNAGFGDRQVPGQAWGGAAPHLPGGGRHRGDPGRPQSRRAAQLIDETPKQGAYGKIAFIHPKGAHGVLVELSSVTEHVRVVRCRNAYQRVECACIPVIPSAHPMLSPPSQSPEAVSPPAACCPPAAATPAQVEANIRHLVWEITWFGVVWGAVVNFLQVYVVRLGVSSLLVGAITYGPALVGIFWQCRRPGLITRTGHRMRWVIGSWVLYRVTFLLMALAPFVYAQASPGHGPGLVPQRVCRPAISNVAFLSMLADAVPPDR